jgi:RNA polymerase sigma-70 factor, ECF subfamily
MHHFGTQRGLKARGQPVESLAHIYSLGVSGPEDVTSLLVAFGSGDQSAIEHLMPLVYDELRRIAHRRRSRWRDWAAPGTTSLVHEAFMNLVDQTRCQWENRRHFFYFASVAMRNILIDNAKRHLRRKRGADWQQIPLEEAGLVSAERSDDLLALDNALMKLKAADERLSQIVECRFFGGLSVEETAEALSLSPATVKRGWNSARVWLHKEMGK